MSHTVSPWINTAAFRPRVYKEWPEILPGDVHPRIFRMDELKRVRASIRMWNARHRAVLSIRRYPNGTEEHPDAHFRVGWDPSHSFNPAIIRTSPQRVRKRPVPQKRKDAESESG